MNIIKRHKLAIMGLIGGAIAGYLYFLFAGCDSGCAISSKPLNSTIYGAVSGFLFLSAFNKKEDDRKPEE